MNSMSVTPLQTRIFRRGEKIVDFIVQQVPSELVRERMILAVTSKIVSVAEGRFCARAVTDKRTLVKREADWFLGEIGHGTFLTIKHGHMIASAGIDESNSETDEYILYPEDPYRSAERLWQDLRREWKLNELGILLTDSKTTPLRRGTSGVALSYWGFRAVVSLVDTPDLFGRTLRMTCMNLADGLAAATVMTMGEGRECRPLAVVNGAEVEFTAKTERSEIEIPLVEDLYYPILHPRVENPR